MENKTVYMVFKENGCVRKIEYEIIDSNDINDTVVLKLKSPVKTNNLIEEFVTVIKAYILDELELFIVKELLIDIHCSLFPQYFYTYKILEDDKNGK